MNYYIQGNKEKADQIKTAFGKYVSTQEMAEYDFSQEEYLFYTGQEERGTFVYAAWSDSVIAEIIKTHPDYKELGLPKPHYDIANFKPFDKVLVRDNDRGKWRPSIFSYHIKGRQTCYPFCCIGNSFSQCIPFEGNEHLLGTTDMPDEMYINW